MKNYWLSKWETKILQPWPAGSSWMFAGKWLIMGWYKDEQDEYVRLWDEFMCGWGGGQLCSQDFGHESAAYYLHKNGIWAKTTMIDEVWSGYYDTKEEAVEMLAKPNKKPDKISRLV